MKKSITVSEELRKYFYENGFNFYPVFCKDALLPHMFKQQKQYLGLKSFMIRSAKAIDRFLVILTLAYFCFTWKSGLVLPFSVGIRRYRGAVSVF